MSKKIDPKDNAADQSNANKGSKGTNIRYDKGQGNRGKQIQQEMNKKQGEK